MEGDACSIHHDRMAVGYYSTSSYGLNGCAECIKNNRSAKISMYNLKNARKIWNANQRRDKKLHRELLADDSKPVLIGDGRGSNWELYGQDKLDYLNKKSALGYGNFKDKRSNFYDSSD